MKHMKTIAMISAACLIFTGMTAALPASADFAAADINSDGAVSVEDAQYILRFYTQKMSQTR